MLIDAERSINTLIFTALKCTTFYVDLRSLTTFPHLTIIIYMYLFGKQAHNIFKTVVLFCLQHM